MRKMWAFSVLLLVVSAAALHAGAPDEGTPLSDAIRDLTDPDPGKRAQAAQALGKMGPEAAGAAGALATALGDLSASVRRAAAWALGQIGPAASVAVPQLALALQDPDWTVRGTAATALTKLGYAASPAVPQLRAGLNDPNELTRSAMAAALWQVTGDGGEAQPVLRSLLHSPDAQTRRYVMMALELLGPTAAPTIDAVLFALKDSAPSVRRATAQCLGKLGVDTPQVRSALQTAANDEDEGVQDKAQAALAALGVTSTPPSMPQAGADVTAYLSPLRAHKEALTALQARLQTMQNQPKPTTTQQAQQWAENARTLGRDIRGGGQGFYQTLHSFVHARTRAGLIEELELARFCMGAFATLTDQYRLLIKADPAAYQVSLKNALISELKNYLIYRGRSKAIEKLQKFGVEDILNAASWGEARQKTVERLHKELNTRIERKTQEVFGLKFHNAATARVAIRTRVHQEVDKQVARLLMKFTGNSLVIEFVGGMIVRWLERDLWPRLREAFRHKGNLRERVDRSKETMAEARRRLFALTPDAGIEDVQTALRGCEGTMAATRYLVGDLKAARQAGLMQELEAAAADLKRLMNLTSARFLLGKRNALEELGGEEEVLRGLLTAQNRLIGLVKTPAVAPTVTMVVAPAPPARPATTAPAVSRPALIQFGGPMYLVHIIETSTMYGPQRKDAWILHPKQPENNTLLTADGSGGQFINKTDRFLGPYTTNHQVGPVLVANRISGVWYGERFISGEARYWQ